MDTPPNTPPPSPGEPLTEPAMEPAMKLALEANFGSIARWREAFATCGQAPGGGAAMLFMPDKGTLVVRPAAQAGAAADGAVPVLEAAPHGRGIEAVIAAINWAEVYRRYQHAVHEASEPFGAGSDEVAHAPVLDVRRAGVFEQARTMIPGARWADPAGVGRWAAGLPAARPLLVYCVYGHEVSRATALRLRAAGLNARYLRGGIHGWQAAGRPLAARPAGTTP